MHESSEQLGSPERWRRIRRVTGVAAVALAGAALVTACGSSSSSGGGESGEAGSHTLNIGVAGDPETLDPEWGQAQRANETLKNIYAQWTKFETVDSGEGYLRADLSKDPVGDALESYEVSKDGKNVKMTVRQGIKMPDGTPINADTFVYKTDRMLGMKAGSVFDLNVLGITKKTEIKKTGEYTLEFNLPKPSPIVGQMLRDQDAGLVNPASVKENSTKDDPWGTKWLARTGAPTGAYMIDSYQPGTQLILKANPNYWGDKPYFDRVVVRVIPSNENRSQLLRNGTIDIAEDLSGDAINRFKDTDGVKVVSVPSIGQTQLGFVTNKKPFDNVKLRQAIAAAIPYQQLVDEVLGGDAQVAQGIWPQNSAWFDKATATPNTTDPAKAKQLLSEAGASDLSFTVQMSDGDADAEALAVPIQTALKQVGVEMKISKLPAAQFQENLVAGKADAWIRSGMGSYVDDPYYAGFLYFADGAAVNWYKYDNPEVTKLVDGLGSTVDRDARTKLAAELQAKLNADVPAIALAEPSYRLPVRSDISGVLWEPDSLLTYKYLKRAG
jgi:peptide/nickel transport system substrate-binding protein